jgi:hypothetical protein
MTGRLGRDNFDGALAAWKSSWNAAMDELMRRRSGNLLRTGALVLFLANGGLLLLGDVQVEDLSSFAIVACWSGLFLFYGQAVMKHALPGKAGAFYTRWQVPAILALLGCVYNAILVVTAFVALKNDTFPFSMNVTAFWLTQFLAFAGYGLIAAGTTTIFRMHEKSAIEYKEREEHFSNQE